jgi:hypothetical protein
MAKKAPRGKLLKLKPKAKAKVIPIKPSAKKKAKVIALSPKRKKKTATRAVPRPEVPLQVMPPPIESDHADEGLREAMEELIEARLELARLGHELSLAHRELENRKLSSGSAQENLRAELAAVRTDLKTALAELEISRNEVERLRGKLAQNEAASALKKPAGSSPSV